MDQKYRVLSSNLKVKGASFRDSLMLVYGKDFRDSITNRMREQDILNQIEFKNILNKYGWPGIKLVGYDGDQSAWLIVQHADQDIVFQRYCLKMIVEGLKNQNTRLKNYPYLIDRLQVNEGKLQFFGTQFTEIKNSENITIDLKPEKIQDPNMVNKIRHCFSLETIEEYLAYAKNRYQIK